MDADQLSRMKNIKYDKLEDGEMGIIEPAKTQASQLRVVAQDSIFVYFEEGYIGRSHFKNKIIPKEMKKGILDFIKKVNNINQNTIYNDLIGFIENEENYDKARILFYRGNAKYQSGEYKEGIEDYNQAIELNPQYAEAYNNRGNAKKRLGEYKEAIKDYNQAIELNPQYAKAYYNRGNAKKRLREYKEAIQDYSEAIELNPQYAKAYCNQGLVKDKLGDKTGAIKDYNQAIELNPQYAKAYYKRGFIKEKLGDKTGAIKDYNQAIELNPQYAQSILQARTCQREVRR